MLQRYIFCKTKAEYKQIEVSGVVEKMNTVPYPKSSFSARCTNCERIGLGLDDDGYCEDCVIEIGITREEAKHDID